MKTTVTIFLILILSVSAFAGQPAGTWELGLRLGLFSNTNDELVVNYSNLTLFSKKTNPFIEGTLSFWMFPSLAIIANAGSYSKGDLRFQVDVDSTNNVSFLGEATIYPLQIGVRISPLEKQMPYHAMPFIDIGGALVIGRENIRSLYYDPYISDYSDGSLTTETSFGWWAATGFQVPIAKTFLLDLVVKYQQIKFNGDIAGIEDYSGIQVTVGFSYLFIKETK